MNALSTVPAWVNRELYPFEPRVVAGLSTVDEGQGPPVVLVHGTPSWSFEWRHLVRGLASDYRVLAPDHRGFGLSASAEALRPEDHAERLLAWFDALELEGATVVLHDFGGPIGLPLALERRVAGLVCMNTFAFPLRRWDTRLLSWLMGTPLGRWLYVSRNASPRWIVPSAYGDRARLTPEIHRHYLEAWPRERRHAAHRLAIDLSASDEYYARLEARLGELDLPALLVWGMADPAFGPRELGIWQAALPQARTVELDGVGHFPQEEAPDAVLAALRDFLARV